jgi:hypothetical protein
MQIFEGENAKWTKIIRGDEEYAAVSTRFALFNVTQITQIAQIIY